MLFLSLPFIYRGIGVYRNVPWIKRDESLSEALLRSTRQLLVSLVIFPLQVFHPDTRAALLSAAKMSLMLMFIIFNALIFSHTLTALEIPAKIAESIVEANMAPWVFLLLLNILLLLGGQFMEPSGLLLIVVPIAVPIAQSLGIDLIHLGIIMVVNMEIGLITPSGWSEPVCDFFNHWYEYHKNYASCLAVDRSLADFSCFCNLYTGNISRFTESSR